MVSHVQEHVFAALASAAHQRGGELMTAQGLANATWAFSTAEHCDEKVCAFLAESRLSIFSVRDIAGIAWALATSALLDAKLFTALAAVAEPLVSLSELSA
eukprot:gnl/TRDRNA2_/TRDRNA2_161756_c1_seq4.p2 gnl/TRDRNA2_/TRDRNA2_161756_c1~~gnl/TRDRNA2_/TRDRNA2_161756_c1_seq4.p2  ORF type:complete len:101 (+),score=19.83 gnl/TRDRNA2_/TRDRNA2_161756_c1_seq4:143-445(+)